MRVIFCEKTKLVALLLVAALLVGAFSGCSAGAQPQADPGQVRESEPGGGGQTQPSPGGTEADVLPWREALAASLAAAPPMPPASGAEGNCRAWYQVFVYSFFDSDGDGIGDLNGVASMLDYIQGMGFDGIWLSPIHPSDTYHKYNVRDYLDVDPEYGTLGDFDSLLAQCHERGMSLILDLVINHTDLYHPWFAEHPEYYNISDSPGNGGWAPLPDGRYYECQFWDHMPDLNLESPEVRAEIVDICRYWFERGVDGFRLDAAKEYVTGNSAKNIEILSWFSAAVKQLKPDAYLVAEVWDTTSSLYQYYQSGVDSFFDFPFSGSDGAIATLMLRSDATVADYFNRVAAVQDTILSFNPNASNASFFTNHDMSRAAGFLRRDPDLIKTAWGLSLLQPGDVFLYYGEELGMSGSGKDENKRAPMFWTDDPSAEGMASGPPGREEQMNSFDPAVAQAGDPGSILSYVRGALALRREFPQIARGSFEVIPTDAGDKAGAVRRVWQGGEVVVAYNVSADAVVLSLPGVLRGWLSATGEEPSQTGGALALPGYCIAVLAIDG